MSNYVIVSDSSADLSQEMVEKLNLHIIPMPFILKDKVYLNHPDGREMNPSAFYQMLRDGESATTNALNASEYEQVLLPLLQQGKDILLVVFSSGLSCTYQSACMAVEELKEQFPDRKIRVVDSLAASLGQGLLLWHAANLKTEGKSIDEVTEWIEQNKLNLCHQVTVNDLHFLKRGGRISSATAVVGSMLSVKPILHIDNEGKLINNAKARGRAAALKSLVDTMEKTAIHPESQMVFISHGDCLDDAKLLAQQITDRLGTTEFYFSTIGPVIGAHAGPGTIALFYLGTER